MGFMKKFSFYTLTAAVLMFGFEKDLKAEVENNVEGAKQFIEETIETVYNELPKKKGNQEVFSYLKEFTEEKFAFQYMSSWSLGSGTYNQLSEEDKEKYVDISKEFMVLLYGELFNNYYKAYKYEFVGTSQKSDSLYEVSMKFSSNNSEVSPEDTLLNVTWVIRYSKGSNQFYIIDVSINNITFLAAQRKQYSSILRSKNNDYKLFLEDLADKNKAAKEKLGIEL